MVDRIRERVAALGAVSLDRQRDHIRGFLKATRGSSATLAASLIKGGKRFGPDPGVECVLHRYSYFGGKLQVAGQVRSEGIAVIGMGIRVPGRKLTWLEPGFVPGPDPGAWSSFSFAVPCGDVRTGLDWKLCAALRDGSWVDLGQARHEAAGRNDFDMTISKFWDLLAERGSGRLLEIGARARSGLTHIDGLPADWDYVGFDIVPGPNVDVQGDAHELSKHFEPESFDAVLSVSTFEHLAMPWKVVVEINRVLRPGGLVCVMTHQTWNVHEEPWDFWRFSEYTWPVLFNARSGFEMVAAAMGQKAQIVAILMNDITAGLPGAAAYLGTVAIARKTGPTELSWGVNATDVVSGSYPG
jgi:SAM-dependent methyltransferase